MRLHAAVVPNAPVRLIPWSLNNPASISVTIPTAPAWYVTCCTTTGARCNKSVYYWLAPVVLHAVLSNRCCWKNRPCWLLPTAPPEKAVELARLFCDLGHIEGCGLDDVAGQSFDLIINATAASLAGQVPALPDSVVTPDCWCYDMMYADRPTAFMDWARQRGAARCMDGLGMLVEQAAEAFFLWRGVRPDTRPVIRQLRTHA